MLPILRKKTPRWIWWVLIYFLIAAARIGWIWYDRSRPMVLPAPRQALFLKAIPDSLSTIPKFGIVDLEEAQSLVGKTLWWKAGYQVKFAPLNIQAGHSENRSPLLFPSITPVQVSRIFKRDKNDILLVIEYKGAKYATSIALYDPQAQVHHFLLDDLFFPGDPFQYYRHWDAATRQHIQSHEIAPQMTFAQVVLSLGNGQFIQMVDKETQLYHFASLSGGRPGTSEVVFVNGRLSSYKILPPAAAK